jgi:hypothetical protein
MKIFMTFIVFTYFSFSGWAQNATFVEAKIITNSGDTSTGYIERLADSKLSKQINFKINTTDTSIQIFTPIDIKAFYLKKDNIYYESIDYDKDFSKTEKRFATLIMSVYCSLYSLDLLEKEIKQVADNNNKVYIF